MAKRQGFKVFNNGTTLEEEMNFWVAEHPEYRIKRTQLASANGSHGILLSALVNYEYDDEVYVTGSKESA